MKHLRFREPQGRKRLSWYTRRQLGVVWNRLGRSGMLANSRAYVWTRHVSERSRSVCGAFQKPEDCGGSPTSCGRRSARSCEAPLAGGLDGLWSKVGDGESRGWRIVGVTNLPHLQRGVIRHDGEYLNGRVADGLAMGSVVGVWPPVLAIVGFLRRRTYSSVLWFVLWSFREARLSGLP